MGAYAPKGDTYPRNTSKNRAYGHPDARFPRVFWGELGPKTFSGFARETPPATPPRSN